MSLIPRFYRLRLRNASLLEIVCRIQQGISRAFLKCLFALGLETLRSPTIELDSVGKLKMVDLYADQSQTGKNGIPMVAIMYSTTHRCNEKTTGDWTASVSGASVQDIRSVWEPARLQQAVTLLVLADQNRGGLGWEKPEQAAKGIVFSWIDANPFPWGVHYQSAMECAMRIPVFFMVIKGVDGLTPDESGMLLTAIYRHGWLISRQLSLYSSLGNHTIAEGVGLIFAGAVYRSTRRGRDWLGTGIRLLDEELNHQILDDGGPAEQSLGYHRFVLDLYWLAYDFIRKNNLGSVDSWRARLTVGESFLGAFQDRNRLFPAIGDSDDGFAVAPGINPDREPLPAMIENHRTFAESGYSVIRNDRLVFTFDHGPLGMAPFFNHGHADALSITVSKNGYPLLVDPGTYRYNGVTQWRRYFKGTRAHNTVTIDDQDQAVQETSFIWSKPYNAQLTAFESGNGELFYNATHDGYLRLRSPVRHHRSVFFFEGENFLVKDRFVGTGMHCFQLNFHLHPAAEVGVDGPWWVVEHGGEQVFLRLLEGAFQSIRGRNRPPLGWYSYRYGQKEPTSTLTFTRTGEAESVVFTTAICTRAILGDDRIDIKAGEFESKIKNS